MAAPQSCPTGIHNKSKQCGETDQQRMAEAVFERGTLRQAQPSFAEAGNTCELLEGPCRTVPAQMQISGRRPEYVVQAGP